MRWMRTQLMEPVMSSDADPEDSTKQISGYRVYMRGIRSDGAMFQANRFVDHYPDESETESLRPTLREVLDSFIADAVDVPVGSPDLFRGMRGWVEEREG